jgi:flagellar hook protein FlgE
MSSALWIGTTGLTASSKQMDVIGNNLANSNTVGFKASDTLFASMLNQSLSGGEGNTQVGQGVSIAEVSTQFGQGSFESTGNATDLAIDGDGFFTVKDAEGAQYFTRAGAFHINAEGYLVDVNNYRVQGFNLYVPGQEDQQTDISLQNVQSAPKTSTEIGVGANLNDSAAAGEKFNVTQTVYDSKGAAHNLGLRFMKTDGNGMWGFDATLDSTNVSTGQAYSGLKFDDSGNLEAMYTSSLANVAHTAADASATATATVDRIGQLYKSATGIELTRGTGPLAWTITNNGGYANAAISSTTATTVSIDLDGMGGDDITFNLGGTWASGDKVSFNIAESESPKSDVALTFAALDNGATIGDQSGGTNQINWNVAGDGSQVLTGYASTSVIKTLTDNGYSSGVLKSLSVSKDGIINGFFTNGQSAELGQIMLASFPNNGGLKKAGNYFTATVLSGEAIKNQPGSSGLGQIMSNSLEISNTDVAKEFINMISAQRTYQANAKVITTADQLLSVLMNIKQ